MRLPLRLAPAAAGVCALALALRRARVLSPVRPGVSGWSEEPGLSDCPGDSDTSGEPDSSSGGMISSTPSSRVSSKSVTSVPSSAAAVNWPQICAGGPPR